jgi:two-component system sensor histidine kinase KdpD
MTSSDFLTLLSQRDRGKLKLYIGSAAGVGKSYRMLVEAHELRARGVDVVGAYVETHGRVDTVAQMRDLELVPRKQITYRDVTLEEMDLEKVLQRSPQVALVDELAHTNVPGSRHAKRWEDVTALLDAGINVISAVNIQHLESLNDVIAGSIGVTVRETVPDWIVASAEQVVNVDISAEDLRERLSAGKIYKSERIDSALRNFFTVENLATLRELALREVASSVDKTREQMARLESGATVSERSVDRVMVAMSSRPPHTASLLRTASRIAGRLNSDWYCVYVQTPGERADRIDSTVQRGLVANIQLAQSMGAEVVKLESRDVAAALDTFAAVHRVSLIVVGQGTGPAARGWFRRSVTEGLISRSRKYDVLVCAPHGDQWTMP